MMRAATAKKCARSCQSTLGASTHARERDRFFFSGLALAATGLVITGFAPTYFLKVWFGTTALPPILHAHGLVMTSWFVLLVVQTSLVATGRTDLHRRLGVAGAVIAVVIVILTVVATIIGLRVPRGLLALDPTMVLVSLGTTAQFAAFVGVALLYRRNADAHKRLMFIATAVLLSAAVGRLIGGPSTLAAARVWAVSDTPVLAMIVYDVVRRGRVHGSLVWGGLTLVGANACRRPRDTQMPGVLSSAGYRAERSGEKRSARSQGLPTAHAGRFRRRFTATISPSGRICGDRVLFRG